MTASRDAARAWPEASAERTRLRLEIGLVALSIAFASWRISAVDAASAATMAILGAIATVLSLTRRAQWRFLPMSHYRPGADEGLVYAVMLLPLMIAGRMWSSAALVAPLSADAMAYLAYNLHQSLVFGILVIAWTTLSPRVLSTFKFLIVIVLAVLLGASIATVLSGERLGSGLFLHAIISLAVLQALTMGMLLVFPRSFSLAEASVLSSLISLLGMDAWTATFFRFNIRYLPDFMDLERLPVHLFLESLILGIILIGILTSPLLVLIKRTGARFGVNSPRNIVLTAAAVASFAAVVFFLISPWMHAFLRQDPFEWTFSFIFERKRRVALTLFWAAAIAVSVGGLAYAGKLHDATSRSPRPVSIDDNDKSNDTKNVSNDVKNASNSAKNIKSAPSAMRYKFKAKPLRRIPLILVRKYFHLLAVVMFSPGYILEPNYLQLAFGVALAALIAIEYVRLFQLAILGPPFQAFFGAFSDERDSGPLIMSHLYLLIGCALPVWLACAPPDAYFAGFSGILALGIGDTMASVFGVLFGRHTWPQTKKTYEGTVAGILSLLAVAVLLAQWAPDVLQYSGWQWVFYAMAATTTGLLEALTKQNDNLVVPVFLFALVSLI